MKVHIVQDQPGRVYGVFTRKRRARALQEILGRTGIDTDRIKYHLNFVDFEEIGEVEDDLHRKINDRVKDNDAQEQE